MPDEATEAPSEPPATPTEEPALYVVTPDPTATPEPSPTPEPTPVPTATPTPSPSPTPAPTPGVEVIYYRTSEVYHGSVLLTRPETFTAVTVRMWDRGLDEALWEHALTQEELQGGAYEFSGYDLYAEVYSDEFMEQHGGRFPDGYEPDPVLQVDYAFENGNTAVSDSVEAEAVYELWASVRYDLPDASEDFLAYFMEQTTYPDSFVLRIDETPYDNIRVRYGEPDPDDPPQKGDIWVTLTYDGQTLSGEGATFVTDSYPYEGYTFYAYALVIPRPESLPEHGTVQVRIVQHLLHYDYDAVKEREIEY